MIGELVELANNCSIYSKTERTDPLIIQVLAVPGDTPDQMLAMISAIKAENARIVPYVHASQAGAYEYITMLENPAVLPASNTDTLKVSLFKGLKEIASNLYQPCSSGMEDTSLLDFIYKALVQIGRETSVSSLCTTMKELNSFIDLSHYYKFTSCNLAVC